MMLRCKFRCCALSLTIWVVHASTNIILNTPESSRYQPTRVTRILQSKIQILWKSTTHIPSNKDIMPAQKTLAGLFSKSLAIFLACSRLKKKPNPKIVKKIPKNLPKNIVAIISSLLFYFRPS